jgi:hypothetical protein
MMLNNYKSLFWYIVWIFGLLDDCMVYFGSYESLQTQIVHSVHWVIWNTHVLKL